jgi:hypothetical protein
MFLHVSDAKYEGEYRLRLTFDDGTVKAVDLRDELSGPVFEPLRNVKLFRQVAVNIDTGTVEWPNGADFAPEFLYRLGSPVEDVPARKVAEARPTYRKEPRR